jgi:ABC-type Fe3+-citrate transport system substrate-binding protein
MNTKIITFGVFATLFMGAYVALCCLQPDKANPVLVLSIAFAVVAFLCFICDSCKECCTSCCCKSIKDLEGKIEQQKSRITTQESQIADAKKAVEEKILPIGKVSDDEVRKHNDELRDLLGKFEGMGKTLTEIKKDINEVKVELDKIKSSK